jgi:hypothetical protein
VNFHPNFKHLILNMASLLDLEWWPQHVKILTKTIVILHTSFVFVKFHGYWDEYYMIILKTRVSTKFERLKYWNCKDIGLWIYQDRTVEFEKKMIMERAKQRWLMKLCVDFGNPQFPLSVGKNVMLVIH